MERLASLAAMLWFHQNWFWVSVISTGLVGTWGLGLAIAKRPPALAFYAARVAAISAMLIQVGAGVWMYVVDERRPGNDFHLFYGVVIAFTLSLAYVYRSQLGRKPDVGYGLLLLFVMGLGLRAWANVS
jgi:hypothetical protein